MREKACADDSQVGTSGVTATRLFARAGRRWPWLLGVLLTLVSATGVSSHVEAVYWTHVDVVFLPPNSPLGQGNVLEGDSASLVHFAALVEREINGSRALPRLSSAEATLYGAGVRRGYSVTLPNLGGQWQTNFNRPALSIEVVDSSEARVRAVLAQVVGRVQGLARGLQERSGVSAGARIWAQQFPETISVSYVTGNHKRATGASILLGSGLVLSAAVIVAGRGTGRRLRQPGRHRSRAEVNDRPRVPHLAPRRGVG